MLESKTKELETRREALSLDNKLVEDRLREVENRDRELDKREEMLGKVAKDNELKEKHLEMKQKEIEDKEKDVEGIREKIMDLRKELEKLDTVKPISDELRKKSRGREEEVDANNGISSSTARSPKRSRPLVEINSDDARTDDGENDDDDDNEVRTNGNDNDNDDDDNNQVSNGDSIAGSESKWLFNDFEKDKLLRIGAGQVWASFYNRVEKKIDELPRSYVRILRVLRGQISQDKIDLYVAWLSPRPIGRSALNKLSKIRFPVDHFAFERKKYSTQSWSASPDMLSHQVYCEVNHSPFVLVPREGEVWALYKDWDIRKGAFGSEIEENCKYDIVVVLSSIDYRSIHVAYLDKLAGFVSLFHRRLQANSFCIRGDDLRRFSHQVPSFKMMGCEGEGVPEGSFELDPRALPLGLCSDLQHSGET